jgi:hypothetical protein
MAALGSGFQTTRSCTPGGFDSHHQSYANVIEQGDELWMFYVGSSFGSTGIGLATMKKSELR